MIPGTPHYLAPEQVSGSRDLDERVDVWAAGLTFYEMLVGRRAYEASSYIALVSNILGSTLPRVSTVRGDLPPGFDDVLAKALAKDRDQRFRSATAFRTALVDVWARFRTAGVRKGDALRKFRPEAPTLPIVEEVSTEDMTEINVHVQFDPDD